MGDMWEGVSLSRPTMGPNPMERCKIPSKVSGRTPAENGSGAF